VILENKVVRWSLFLLVTSIVLYAVFRALPPKQIFEHSDKVGHIVAFSIWGLTGRLALVSLSKTYFWLPMVVLAFLLEYLQGEFQPLRVFSLDDAYANLIGVIIAFVMAKLFFMKKRKLSF